MKHTEEGARSPPGPRRGRPDSAEQRPAPPAATQSRLSAGRLPRGRRSASRQHRRGKNTPLTLLGRRGEKKTKTRAAQIPQSSSQRHRVPQLHAGGSCWFSPSTSTWWSSWRRCPSSSPTPTFHLAPPEEEAPPAASPRPQRGSPLLRGGGRRANPRPEAPPQAVPGELLRGTPASARPRGTAAGTDPPVAQPGGEAGGSRDTGAGCGWQGEPAGGSGDPGAGCGWQEQVTGSARGRSPRPARPAPPLRPARPAPPLRRPWRRRTAGWRPQPVSAAESTSWVPALPSSPAVPQVPSCPVGPGPAGAEGARGERAVRWRPRVCGICSGQPPAQCWWLLPGGVGYTFSSFRAGCCVF